MQFGKGSDGNKDKGSQTEYTPAGLSIVATATGTRNSAPSSTSQLDAYLGQGCKANGKLSFVGPVEINSEIEGEIEAGKRLTIGESAVIRAKVRGAEIIIKGRVEGDVVASERLILKPPAIVKGNISAPILIIEEGVSFEGSCTMRKDSAEKQAAAG